MTPAIAAIAPRLAPPIPLVMSGVSAPARKSSVSVFPVNCSSCHLRELCMPSGLPTAETKRVGEAVSTRKRVKRGDALIRTGSAFESLYAVRSGFFKSTVILEDGRGQVTAFHMAGEVVGLDGVGSGAHSAEVIALEDSEVCVIPHIHLARPSLQAQLHKVMGQELVRGQVTMMLLGSMRSDERLAAFLLNLSQRFLARGFSPHEFHLRMTRDEIGSYLGLSLETVSRLFSRFSDGQLIRVQQRHVRILDAAALRRVVVRQHDQERRHS